MGQLHTLCLVQMLDTGITGAVGRIFTASFASWDFTCAGHQLFDFEPPVDPISPARAEAMISLLLMHTDISIS